MKRYIAILLIVLPSICSADEFPPSIDFHTNGIIEDGNVFGLVRTFDEAIVDMTGGIINSLELYNNSTLNANGGKIEGLDIVLFDSSTLNLYYLQETNNRLNAYNTASINIYGKGFEYDDYYHLRGYWANGDPFAFSIRTDYTYERITLFEIPEPCTFLLTIFGVLGFVKKYH
jgi:hypothetical protein